MAENPFTANRPDVVGTRQDVQAEFRENPAKVAITKTPEFREIQALYPWLPAELIYEYVQAWKETGDPTRALNAMRSSKAYQVYFPGNTLPNGQVVFDEAQYVSYVEQAKNLMRQAGLPKGFYDDPQDFGLLISGQVSLNELRDRIEEGVLAAQYAPQEVKSQLKNMYGVEEGDIAAFFLDPTRATKVIQQKWAAAQIGGGAIQTGFGELRRSEAEWIAERATVQEAQRGLSELAQLREVTGGLPGMRDGRMSREEQLRAAFDQDADAINTLRRRQAARRSLFEGGGGAAASAEGIRGAGSASN